MKNKVVWFIPNLISTDLTKNYSIFQDFLLENYGYEKVIVTNKILDKVDSDLNIVKSFFIKTRYGYFYNFIKIFKFLKKDNVFLIYDNSLWMISFMVLIKKFIDIKVILKLDSSLEIGCLNNKKAFLFKRLDLIIYESETSKIKLVEKSVENIHLLYNGLIKDDIEYLQNNIKKENIILFAGRITSAKQVNLLIDIFSEIKNESFRLVICGPLNETGTKEATKYQLEFLKKVSQNNNIDYKGVLSGKEYLDIFKKAKILILPSKGGEGLPNVLSYGFFSKCFVMATNVGSISEYLTLDNSCLINDISKSSIQKEIVKAFDTIESKEIQKKILNGYQFAIDNLEYEKQFKKIARIING